MKTKVYELKNFEGYEFNCNCCGRVIKHVYAIQNRNGIFGKDCAKSILGKKAEFSAFNFKPYSPDCVDAFKFNNNISF